MGVLDAMVQGQLEERREGHLATGNNGMRHDDHAYHSED